MSAPETRGLLVALRIEVGEYPMPMLQMVSMNLLTRSDAWALTYQERHNRLTRETVFIRQDGSVEVLNPDLRDAETRREEYMQRLETEITALRLMVADQNRSKFAP